MRINAKTINVFSLGCLIALIFCPLLQVYLKVAVFYPLLLLWMISALIIDNVKVFPKSKDFWYLFYICLLFVAAFLFTQNSFYLRRIITVILISYSSVFMYSFYSRHIDLIKKYVWFVYVCLLIGIITTMIGLVKYPIASRILATSGEDYAYEYSLYKKSGIGGYEFIYTLVMFLIFMPNVLKANTGVKKAFLIVLHIGMLVCIFLSGYTTAILLTIVISIVSIVVSKKNGNVIVSAVIVVLLSLIGVIFMRPILEAVAKLADNFDVYYVSTRINQLLYAEETHDILSLERGQLYLNAIKNFMNSPIVGIIKGHPMLKSGHSQTLGYLETFGIFGVPYITYMIGSFKRKRLHILNTGRRNVLFCCNIFYVIFSIINTVDVAYSLVWTGYFVLPVIALIYDNTERETIIRKRK